MTEEKKKLVANEFLSALKNAGSEIESDISQIGSPSYKPFYRSCVLFTCDCGNFYDKILQGEKPSLEEAKQILRMVDLWFVEALRMDERHFDYLFEDIKKIWDYIDE